MGFSEKNIQTVFFEFFPRVGGGQVILSNLLNYIAERETISPHIIVSSEEVYSFFRQTQENVYKIPCVNPDNFGLFRYFAHYYNKCVIEDYLKKFLKEKGIKVISSGGFLPCLYSVEIADRFGIPVVWHVQCVLPEKFIFSTGFRRIAGKISLFIAVSEAIKEDLIRNGIPDNKVIVGYNGLDTSVWNPEYQTTLTLDQLAGCPIDPGVVVFTMIGEITSMKGQEIFIKAARKILEAHSDVVFFIVGVPNKPESQLYFEDIKNLAGEDLGRNIFFTGKRSDIKDILKLTSVSVVPSQIPDALPTVVLESMAMGKPVIGSKIGGIPEMIKDGYNGYLFQPSNEQELCEKMKLFICNPKKIHEMGINGFETIKKEFNIQITSAKFVEGILGLIK